MVSHGPARWSGSERGSLIASRVVPILGVLWLGWDARLILFVISCEVIVTSAALGWLFAYPERSALARAAYAAMLAPVGFLMWAVLARGDPVVPVGSLVAESARATALALVVIVWQGIVTARRGMHRAREGGPSIERNDRILIRWLLRVSGPFLVFALVIAAARRFDAVALAGILVGQTILDLALLGLERRWEKRVRRGPA
ncbi:MAG: hypothetical protein KJP18_05150 [Gemmatimonadetes bacterium]|nr:hypothetical protein [Gemmatimonadota bacterium]